MLDKIYNERKYQKRVRTINDIYNRLFGPQSYLQKTFYLESNIEENLRYLGEFERKLEVSLKAWVLNELK